MLEYDEVSRYRVVQTCTQFGCKRMKHVWCKQLLPTQMLSEQHLSHSWIQKPANYANLETARNWKPGKAGNSNDSGKKCRKQSKNEQIWQNTQRMVDAWCSGLLAFSAVPAFPGFFFRECVLRGIPCSDPANFQFASITFKLHFICRWQRF